MPFNWTAEGCAHLLTQPGSALDENLAPPFGIAIFTSVADTAFRNQGPFTELVVMVSVPAMLSVQPLIAGEEKSSMAEALGIVAVATNWCM